MKKTFACLLLLSFFALFVNPVNAQTRQRRVGQNPPPAGAGASTPTRPPVLGGASTTNSGQPGAQSPVVSNGPDEVGEGDIIRVNTTLVTLPVSVTDRDGRFIPNLRKEDFRLWEDGVEQKVAFFASVDKPFSVVLMIDTSGSTRFKIDEIQDAATTFVNQLRPDDQVMVVSFDDDVRILTEFTGDRGRMRDAIRRTRTGDGTKLYDAVDLVINQRLNRVSGRKAVVLFTDGVDTTSRSGTYASNVRDAEEVDALIYPVQYDTYSDVNSGGSTWPGARRPSSPAEILIQILGGIRIGGGGPRGGGGGVGSSRHDYEQADRYLGDLAQKTGARRFQADTTSNLSYAFANIAEELRRQYSLGFYPTKPPQQGQRRQVRVRVNQPNLAVRTRDSYIFDGSGSAGSHDTAQKPAPTLRRKLAEEPIQKRS
jgi:Ca-activated chloride channel family protein